MNPVIRIFFVRVQYNLLVFIKKQKLYDLKYNMQSTTKEFVEGKVRLLQFNG
jgi:hypothetical protein